MHPQTVDQGKRWDILGRPSDSVTHPQPFEYTLFLRNTESTVYGIAAAQGSIYCWEFQFTSVGAW